MLGQALATLANGHSLDRELCQGSVEQIMDGRADPARIAAFLMGLRVKGETVDELEGCARAMANRAVTIPVNRRPLVDTCGTGGDGASTFNISTAAALVVAGAGAAVAKHGNRSVSSKCGSADVMEALGLELLDDPEVVGRSVDETGFGFLFAPHFHPAMKTVAPIRRSLGLRTVFNLLGPVSNPAGAQHQVIGVFSPHWVEPLAEVCSRLGLSSCIVVHGSGGLDEFSLAGPSHAVYWDGQELRPFDFELSELGLEEVPVSELGGRDAAENARIISGVLTGHLGPARDVVLLNAAAALIVSGLAEDWKSGWEQAAAAVDSGSALKTLENAVEFSRA